MYRFQETSKTYRSHSAPQATEGCSWMGSRDVTHAGVALSEAAAFESLLFLLVTLHPPFCN